MKFWLTCFVLLFAGAEFFQWMVNLGGEGLSGAGLVLGGMGLAAASNAKHLPRLASTKTSGEQGLAEKGLSEKTGGKQPAMATNPQAQQYARQAIAHTAKTASGATRTEASTTASDKDSISFKVRLPWR